MSGKKKIGELLVEQGLITPPQLKRALRTQLMLGGHLGTSLIELGFIDEDTLSAALGRALGMRYVTSETLKKLPRDVIHLLRPEIAERYRVIPLGKGPDSLHLAVIAPRDTQPLSTRTGLRIVPWIAPEARILEALETYYGVPRPRRFLALSELDPVSLTRPRATPPSPLSPIEKSVLHAPPGLGPAIVARVEGQRRAGAQATTAPAPPSAPAAVAAPPRPAVPVSAPATVPLPVDDDGPAWTGDEVAMLLSHADSREELAAVVVDYAIQHMAGCILFGVRDRRAFVWDRRGIRIPGEKTAGFEVPLVGRSIFELLGGEPFYRGPVPDGSDTDAFYDNLERSRPAEALLVPVYLNDRLIAVLYGEGTVDEPISIDAEDCLQLATKIAMALNIVILKLKIRAG